jgi:hypothetical protein
VVNRRFRLRIRPGNNPSRACHAGTKAGAKRSGKKNLIFSVSYNFCC